MFKNSLTKYKPLYMTSGNNYLLFDACCYVIPIAHINSKDGDHFHHQYPVFTYIQEDLEMWQANWQILSLTIN